MRRAAAEKSKERGGRVVQCTDGYSGKRFEQKSYVMRKGSTLRTCGVECP